MPRPSDDQPEAPRLIVDQAGNVVRLDGVRVSADPVPPEFEATPGQPAAPDAADEEVVWNPASRISMDGVTRLSNRGTRGGGDAGSDGGGCGGDGGC